MAKLYNRVKVTTATTGTGTVALGAAASNAFATFAEAGTQNADVVTYVIEENTDFEIGRGTYTASGTTLSRDTVLLSKIGGTAGTTKMTLAGGATVRITAATQDIANAATTISAAGLAAGGGDLSANRTVTVTASSNAQGQAGTDTTTAMTPAATAAAIAALVSGTLVSVQSLAATQTVTIPTTKGLVMLWGGTGGAGGANVGGVAQCTGGGGAGAGFLIKYLTGLTPGNTLALTIGAAGSAGAGTPTAGGAGGSSILASGTQTITTLTAAGGSGGGAANGTSGAGSNGGTATNGDLNLSGGRGQDGNDSATGAGPGSAGGVTPGIATSGGSGRTSTAGLAGVIGGCLIYWFK